MSKQSLPLSVQNRPRFEWQAILFLTLLSISLYAWFAWDQIPAIVGDHSWFLQVSRRVAAGETLYRDILWAYGPLPVIFMAWLDHFGRQDIAYFAILHIAIATGGTLTLYYLHRYYLTAPMAALATLLVMFLLGGCWAFLRVYTPGIALGTLALLFTLLGLFETLGRENQKRGGFLIGAGVAVAALSKPEYALGTLLLSFIGLVLWRTSRTSSVRRDSLPRGIVGGVVGGLAAALAVYAYLATQAGLGNVVDGLRGYDQLQTLGLCLLDYYGTGSAIAVLTAIGLIGVAALLAHALYRARGLRVKQVELILATAGFLGYILVTLAWASAWLPAWRRGLVSPFDLATFIAYLKSYPPHLVSYYEVQVRLFLELALAILLLILLWKWIMRMRRDENANPQQILGLLVLFYILLANTRAFLLGLSDGQIPGLILVLFVARPELGWQVPAVRFRPNLRLALAGALALFLVWSNLETAWIMVRPKIPFETPYGTVLLDHPELSLPLQAIRYVEANTTPNDGIGVMGSFPVIYYLTGRQNPFRQDFVMQGVGDNAKDAQDYIERLDRLRPALILVPEGNLNPGMPIGSINTDDPQSGCARRGLFGEAAPAIAQYITAHYRLDARLSEDGWEFAAFKRTN
ncbi:MAG: hypothetical protein WCF84_23850 [Anaerolineae bacterium]